MGAGPKDVSLEPGIHEVARRFVRVLEDLKVSYAVGGAVAMAFAGYVRATRDLDVLVLVPAVRMQEFADALAAQGFVMRDQEDRVVAPDPARMASAGREFGPFRLWWNDTKVEVFSPRVPLQDEILRRRIQVDLGDFAFWLTTAEDLILLKMIFHRPKDIEDARRLIAANRESLDSAYIRRQAETTLATPVIEELARLLDATSP